MNTIETSSRRAAGLPGALVVFVAFQLLVMLAVRADLQITGAGHHASQWPAQMLLCAQVAAMSLLFWDLCGTIRTSALSFALAFPITQLAMPAGSLSINILSCTCLLLWIAGLWGWRRAATTPTLVGSAAAIWTVGSATLWYLTAEFTLGSRSADLLRMVSPLLQALRIGHPGTLAFFAAHAALGLAAAAISTRRSARARAGA